MIPVELTAHHTPTVHQGITLCGYTRDIFCIPTPVILRVHVSPETKTSFATKQ